MMFKTEATMKLSALLATGVAAALLSTAAWADPGHSHGAETTYGKPGDSKKPARIVQIVMRESDGRMLFLPDTLTARRGEQIRFQLRNNGEVDHEFVVGTVEENLKHMKEMEKKIGRAHV